MAIPQPDRWPGLAEGIQSRTLPVRDLNMHILEAGDRTAPLVLLLHGFPELSYSWRKILLPLARAGFHAVAPDLRGCGRTAPPTPIRYDDDPRASRMPNLVRDAVALTFALGHRTAACVVGHDFGSGAASACALARPDLFRACVLMSRPFLPAPPLPFGIDIGADAAPTPTHGPVNPLTRLVDALARLDPPRKHYTLYYGTRGADADLSAPAQGLRAFFRGYYHVKSADWAGNAAPAPHPIPAGVEGFAQLPHYYVMPLGKSMSEVVAADAPSAAEVAAKSARWLDEDELGVYAAEYGRTRFQGGLNWYRCGADPDALDELTLFAGKTIEVPLMYLSGRQDWGVFQNPGALERMKEDCKTLAAEDVVLIEGAGHWVQQERPDDVVQHLVRFLAKQV